MNRRRGTSWRRPRRASEEVAYRSVQHRTAAEGHIYEAAHRHGQYRAVEVQIPRLRGYFENRRQAAERRRIESHQFRTYAEYLSWASISIGDLGPEPYSDFVRLGLDSRENVPEIDPERTSPSPVNVDNSREIVLVFDPELASPLSVNVEGTPHPALWGHKYVRGLVDYVWNRCSFRDMLRIRWHLSDYDSIITDDEVDFMAIDRHIVHDTLQDCESYFYLKFISFLGDCRYIDQSTFDAVVNVIYEEHCLLYHSSHVDYRFAIGVVLLAILSTQRGFSHAMYHAVKLIITSVKTLRWRSRSYPTRDLISIYSGNLLYNQNFPRRSGSRHMRIQTMQVIWGPQ